ncbi:hypothetical protein ABVK25_003364 [Lepraria finkii]|uniref:Required for respiratory growth protein 7, mitochondrial n=1 Tax=Lepraria finkii TaxID=1340010 RepID=A0ABR4BHM6_9LECA
MLLRRPLTRLRLYKRLHAEIRHYSSSSQSLLQPPASSANHRDLLTFRDHSRSTDLSPTSTVHVGTTYEYLCAQTLLHLGFKDLIRTGGRSDKGIDLLGHWVLPPKTSPAKEVPVEVPVIVQCKAVSRKPGPEMIRELEGALSNAPGEWRGGNMAGGRCATREAPGGVREAVRMSEKGVVWIMVEDLDEGVGTTEREEPARRGGRVKQILWNEKVAKMVGDNVGAGVRYVPGLEEGGWRRRFV